MKFAPTSFCLLATVLIAFGCQDEPEDKALQYDRAALAANMADGLIRPAYTALLNQATTMQAKAAAFALAPDAAGLDSLQAQLQALRLSWQAASAYEFGPAATRYLRQSLNTFPADPNQITANINANTWDFGQAQNADARGLPALDYLLHGIAADDAAILAAYQDSGDAGRTTSGLQAILADVVELVGEVSQEWVSYATNFKANTGTDVSSATSYLVNQFNLDLEQLKNARIGIPLGKTTMGQPVLGHVEAPYGDYSVALGLAQLRALRALFQGKSAAGVDGYGLDDALLAVSAQRDGQGLHLAILDAFDAAIAALEAVPDPLELTIANNPALVDAAYVKLQRLIVLTKTDMPSSLGILITYTDNDGD
jgi:uncharacterized protein